MEKTTEDPLISQFSEVLSRVQKAIQDFHLKTNRNPHYIELPYRELRIVFEYYQKYDENMKLSVWPTIEGLKIRESSTWVMKVQ